MTRRVVLLLGLVVAGRSVADVTCYAPYGERPSPGCVAALRKLGAGWYAQLARSFTR